LGRAAEVQLSRSRGLEPSLQVLFAKIARFVLIILAIVLALSFAGIDLTAFAVFSGALGVGLGFGLQKVVSNFMSGIILLLDRSVKPGDVIELGETYGWINKLAARYTSVVTRDGTEFLIPNEDMITQQVINWSHSDRNVRRKIPVQVSYSSDVELAMQLMLEAAENTDRVLTKPAPNCLLRGFGSDGVDLELRMWIDDPYNGLSNVASKVNLEILRLFKQHGIEFPFPQRDVHVHPSTIERLRTLSDFQSHQEPDA
ncbi:MAG: mechanosensitive ion channel domain-containing protein, partial [Pseudomonadota bacterium]